ncbi:hypothetical protein NL108_008652 [Boleophthalmus pectinirostris]|nr:hypothetical protein NL108_008652 [Boleophthalmus pectinirostris]
MIPCYAETQRHDSRTETNIRLKAEGCTLQARHMHMHRPRCAGEGPAAQTKAPLRGRRPRCADEGPAARTKAPLRGRRPRCADKCLTKQRDQTTQTSPDCADRLRLRRRGPDCAAPSVHRSRKQKYKKKNKSSTKKQTPNEILHKKSAPDIIPSATAQCTCQITCQGTFQSTCHSTCHPNQVRSVKQLRFDPSSDQHQSCDACFTEIVFKGSESESLQRERPLKHFKRF